MNDSATHPGAAPRLARDGSRPRRREAETAASHERTPSPVRMLNVGYGNLLIASRIVAIVAPGSSPMRRLRKDASERGKLIDATEGRRTRSIVVMDSDHVVLSAINPETIASRLLQEESGGGEA